jgi:isopenicillin-N epimerase
MVHDNAPVLCDLLETKPLAPLTDNFILQLFSARIKTSRPEQLHDLFRDKYRIQVPVMRQEDKVYLRYSINGFNEQADLDQLFDAIKEIKKTSSLIQAP